MLNMSVQKMDGMDDWNRLEILILHHCTTIEWYVAVPREHNHGGINLERVALCSCVFE